MAESTHSTQATGSSSHTDPFSNPCDLWVLPPPRASTWFARVDWYLNWQLSKGVAYAGLHLPNEVLRLSEEYELTLPAVAPVDPLAPLLVLSQGRLPTSKCMVVEAPSPAGKTFGKPWLEQVHQLSLNLDIHSVHIFLPTKMELAEAREYWNSRFASREARFSADAEAAGL